MLKLNFAAIVLSVVLISGKDEDEPSADNREKLLLTDILRGTLQPQRFNGTWIDDNSFHYFDTSVS
jgi:hypothetical protein